MTRTAVVCAVVVFSGCVSGEGGGATTPESMATTRIEALPYELEVSSSAVALVEEAGLDLEEELRTIADRAFARLPHVRQIVIEVSVDGQRAIPEIGIGGFTDPRDGWVSIWLAEAPPVVRTADGLRMWLHMLVAHELHHSSRIRTGPGYGDLLGEALVTEGLGDSFATEVVADAPTPPWVDALTRDELHATWQIARDTVWSPYDHREWFFGEGDVPRWAGYAIGFDAVQRYLGTSGHTAATAVSVEAHEVLDDYGP